jgi:Domain of unknown function (DUF222)
MESPQRPSFMSLEAEERLVSEMDAAHAAVSQAQLRLFSVIARVDRSELWRDWGAHDTAHWLSMRYGMSSWHADRWIATAHALGSLPEIAEAFARGELGLEKVIELARFATPEIERELVHWARHASRTAVRRRADLETQKTVEDAREVDRSRSLRWWYHDEGRRFGPRWTSRRRTAPCSRGRSTEWPQTCR